MTILDANLVSSNVSENDAPEWAAGTTYAAGQRVMRTANQVHRVYESMANGNVGNVPESTAGIKWIDLGSTNRWRMLRTDANVQTTAASPIVIEVKLPRRVQGIGLLRVDADRVKVQSSDGYSSVQDLRKRYTQGWYDYFYGQLRFRTVALFLDLPRSNSNTVFTITIERLSGGPISCGPVVFGNPVDLGEVQDGSEYGIRDFSTVTRDTFGNATLIKRKRIPSTSQRTILDKEQVEVVQQTLGDLTASVALWFGLEDVTDDYFSALAVLGLITNSKMTLQSTYATLALDLEGL
ncbi:MAG: hypothetical protein PGN26_14610 [Xylophilus ampelinus]